MKILIHTTGTHKSVHVTAFSEAIEVWRQHRDDIRDPIAASDMVGNCGDITFDDTVVARVSYNGRLWTPTGKELIKRNDGWVAALTS